MITWLQTNFQKHYRSFFFVLLVIITLSFVFTLGIGVTTRGQRQVEPKFVLGVDVHNLAWKDQVNRDAEISALLRGNQRGTGGVEKRTELNAYALERSALLHLADRAGIGQPSPTQLRAYVQSFGAFQGEGGRFDASLYQRIIDFLKSDARNTDDDIARILSDEWRIDQASQALSGPGYVLGWEVRRSTALLHTTFSLDAAELSYAAFQPKIEVSEPALQIFFEQAGSRYEIPMRQRVRAVTFQAGEFLSQVSATEEEITRYFEDNKARFRPNTPAAGTTPATPAPEPTLAEVRPEVERQVRLAKASRLAGKAANAFVVALNKAEATVNSPKLETFLASYASRVSAPPPFTREQAPAGSGWPTELLTAAFRLNDRRFISDPHPVGADFVVLLRQETLPPMQPTLAEVRSAVEKDYRETERRRQFIEQGRQVRAQLQARVQAGEAWDAAVRALGLLPRSFDKFTRQAPPAGLDWSVLSRIDELVVGEVSEMTAQADKGLLLRLRARELPSPEQLAAQSAEVAGLLNERVASFTRGAVLGTMIQSDIERVFPPEPAAAPVPAPAAAKP